MEFRVLGKLEAVRDGSPVDLGPFRQRALLALLLTDPNLVFSTDRIIDSLWGGEAGSERQNALWVHVSSLRKALEPGRRSRNDASVLVTRAPGYLIEIEPEDLDARRFEQLVGEGRALMAADPDAASLVFGEALSMWRGRAFEEFAYELFAQAEIARLEELRLQAVEARIEVDLARGLAAELIAELESLVRQHPLREGLTERWMLALYRCGRQAEALRAYKMVAFRLGEELGVEPSAPLRRLRDQIAVGDDALDSHGAGDVSRSVGPGPAVRGYELREQIGSGAFGVAYRAYQPSVGREVAINVIRPELADDPAFIRRFEAEAQLVARLEHPHIVPLYDYWREPGAAYLVMRLMRGGNLADAVARGGFGPAHAAVVAEQLCGALDAAHRAGVVHRGLTTTNILVDDSGNAYLADFGIALGADGRPSDHDVVVGSTLPAPFASQGHVGAEQVTAASDIYSLAVVMAQVLTGGVDNALHSLPAAVANVIERATATDPTQRYQSAGAFASDLVARLGVDEQVMTSRAGDVVNPFKGLRSFDFADAAEFFGRDRLVDRLVAHLGTPGIRSRFLALVGPSGSGKSSVVRAGLLPALRREALPRSDRWFVAQMDPAPHPFESLETALLRVAVNPPTSLYETLTGSVHGLERATGAVLPSDGSQLLLVIDQFEELFTQVAPTVTEQFLDTLTDAVSAEHARVRVVITLRADFYDRPLRHRGVGELLREGTQPITPMTSSQIEHAITGPVEPLGVTFEPALVAELVRDVLDRPGALPLLQYTLTELFGHRRGNRITLDAYEELGGVSGALVTRAERLLSDLGDGAAEATRQIFLRLLTIGDNNERTRRRVLRSELDDLGIPPAEIDEVLDAFGRHRFLTFDRDAIARTPTVEIAHESLLTEWARLRDWAIDAREDVLQQRRLAAAVLEWERSDRDSEYLLTGGRLEQFNGWASTTTLRLSAPESQFLENSLAARDSAVRQRTERDQRTNRRLRRMLLATAGLLAVAIGAGAVAVMQRSNAQDAQRGAEISSLANQSLSLRSSRRDVAALLSIEAQQLRADSESMSALFGTFTNDPGFLGYHRFEGARVEGAIVPHTNTAVVSIPSGDPNEPDTSPAVVDLATGRIGPAFRPMGESTHDTKVAVSDNGTVAVVYGNQKEQGAGGIPEPVEIVAYDIASGMAIGPHIAVASAPGPPLHNVAVNRDGTQAAVAGGQDGTTNIYEVTTGQLLATFGPVADMQPSVSGRDTAAAAWSPDGQLYVGSSGSHLREFDPQTFELVRDITVPTGTTGGLLKFSSQGDFMVARGIVDTADGQTGSAARIDLVDGTTTWVIPPELFGFGSCDAMAFSEPEDRLWCGDYAGVIRGHSLATGALDGTEIAHQHGWLSNLDLVEVAANRYLVAFGRQSGMIARWSVDGGGLIMRRVADGNDFAVYSPDGRWMVVAGPSNQVSGFTASIWSADTESIIRTLPPDELGGAWLDETRLAMITTSDRVRILDVENGTTHDVPGQVEPGWHEVAAVGPNRLALGYGDGKAHIDVYDVRSGEQVSRMQIDRPRVDHIAASADGSRLFVTAFGLYEFDVASGRELHRDADTSIGALAVAADAPVAVGHLDGTISLHDPSDLSVVATLSGFGAAPSQLRYDASGRLLLARGSDNTMALFDVGTRQRIGDSIETSDGDVDLRPDGGEIAVAQVQPPGINLWAIDPDSMAAAACVLAGRNLTSSEWDTYLSDVASYRATCPEYPFPPPDSQRNDSGD